MRYRAALCTGDSHDRRARVLDAAIVFDLDPEAGRAGERRRGEGRIVRGAHELPAVAGAPFVPTVAQATARRRNGEDRKSTRLNSSHLVISYAVFCLKKKKNTQALGNPSTTFPRRR